MAKQSPNDEQIEIELYVSIWWGKVERSVRYIRENEGDPVAIFAHPECIERFNATFPIQKGRILGVKLVPHEFESKETTAAVDAEGFKRWPDVDIIYPEADV